MKVREEKVQIQTDFAKTELLKIAHILYHLRRSTKNWENIYGHVAKEKKKAWEKQADEWLERNVVK